jgi:hypothetical protein
MGKDWVEHLMFKRLLSKFRERKQRKQVLSELEAATQRREPCVRVIKVNFDPAQPGDGYFELEWNVYFVNQLREAGYSGNTEEEIVDLWFTNLCRNIAEEV